MINAPHFHILLFPCFNPCCTGMTFVISLVLKLGKASIGCFNPCCTGMTFVIGILCINVEKTGILMHAGAPYFLSL